MLNDVYQRYLSIRHVRLVFMIIHKGLRFYTQLRYYVYSYAHNEQPWCKILLACTKGMHDLLPLGTMGSLHDHHGDYIIPTKHVARI